MVAASGYKIRGLHERGKSDKGKSKVGPTLQGLLWNVFALQGVQCLRVR